MLSALEKDILRVLFHNNLNISETAKEMVYHRNTIVYHIEQIAKNTGLDPRRFHDAIVLQSMMNGNCKEIRVKYFDPDLEPIRKIGVGDWIDLRSAERVELKQGEERIIRLGVGMILPDGYEAHIVPRSSTPSKFGIVCANSMGVIDNSYSGDADEWRFPAVAIRDTVIEKNDRICQFRIVENQPHIEFITVEHLNKVSRGGIGSTGKR